MYYMYILLPCCAARCRTSQATRRQSSASARGLGSQSTPLMAGPRARSSRHGVLSISVGIQYLSLRKVPEGRLMRRWKRMRKMLSHTGARRWYVQPANVPAQPRAAQPSQTLLLYSRSIALLLSSCGFVACGYPFCAALPWDGMICFVCCCAVCALCMHCRGCSAAGWWRMPMLLRRSVRLRRHHPNNDI